RASSTVGEKAVARGVGQNGACVSLGTRQPVNFHVAEKEKLVLDDRSADVAAILPQVNDIPRSTLEGHGVYGFIIEIVVSVERRVAYLIEPAAVILIGAGPGNELDLRAALRRAIDAGRGRGQGHFFERVHRR